MKKIFTITAVILTLAVGISAGQSRRASEQRNDNKNSEVRSSSRGNSTDSNSRTKSTTTTTRNTDNSRSNKQAVTNDRSNSGNNNASPRTRETRPEPNRPNTNQGTSRTNREVERTPSDNNRSNTRTTSPTTTTRRNSNAGNVQRSNGRTPHQEVHRSNPTPVRARDGKTYTSSRRYVNRHASVHHHHNYTPRSREYRSTHVVYRSPVHVDIVWSPRVYNDYCVIYPELRHWGYNRAYSIHTISAYDAYFHVGELRRVYGRVTDVYYEPQTDEYFLYVGDYYPYHDFSIVVPGYIARQYSRRPLWYFQRENIAVTGLISVWEDRPEMVIARANQLTVY